MYERFVLGDTVSKADGGTFLGQWALTAALDVNGNELKVFKSTANTSDFCKIDASSNDKLEV